MSVNVNSKLRRTRTVIHGWKDGESYFTSLTPRSEKGPCNTHASAQDALQEGSHRHLPIVWETPEEIA